eukprot:CAMPEP_0174852924 /NCGR_PEP_ID=MMETSP1114-20130205/27271_1 /TAXON_ID=312471 /ORGANISM="Neobodo designis, Strain CCAP 1951/1" /LENGTH=507 /DNA_ID=CAMNT_0016087543 /DNA_START=46 /DNA_END=1569 /DNA_ORIENTATION=-
MAVLPSLRACVLTALTLIGVSSAGSAWSSVWTVDMGPGELSSMVLADGSLLVQQSGATGSSTVTSLDPDSGKLRWQADVGGQLPGLMPAHESGLFLYKLRSGSVLAARNVSSGQLQWNLTRDGEANADNLAVLGDFIYWAVSTKLYIVRPTDGHVAATMPIYAGPIRAAVATPLGRRSLILQFNDGLQYVGAYDVTDPSTSLTFLWCFSIGAAIDTSSEVVVTPSGNEAIVEYGGDHLSGRSFGTVSHVLFNADFPAATSLFAASDLAVFAVRPKAVAVSAYSTSTGAEMWHYAGDTPVGFTVTNAACSLSLEIIVCVHFMIDTTGVIHASAMVKLDSSGYVLWRQVFSDNTTGGSIAVGAKPIIVTDTEVIVMWRTAPNATQPVVTFVAERMRLGAPPPPPTTPKPPTPHPTTSAPPAASIVVTEFMQPQCAGATVTRTFGDGECLADGNSTSVLRFCAGGSLHMQTFSASAICGGNPASTSQFDVGTCYAQPVLGGSMEVTRCAP